MMEGRRRRLLPAAPSEPAQAADPAPDAIALPTPADGIPAHVWALLQDAGEAAAERLRDMLRSRTFDTLAPSARARLIELALVRAYGLPVRRSVSVSLSSEDADAVAASLADLADLLPERRSGPAMRDVTPSGYGDSPDEDGA